MRFDTFIAMVREIQVFWDMRTRIASKLQELLRVLQSVTYYEACLFTNPVMTLTGACGLCEICLKYSTESLLYLCNSQVKSFFLFGTYTGYTVCFRLYSISSFNYEGHLESKERFAIKKYLLIIGKKKNMQVLSHTFTYFST